MPAVGAAANRPNRCPTTHAPDVALLRPWTPCFNCPPFDSSTAVVPTTAANTQDLIMSRRAVYVAHPDCSRTSGVVKAAVSQINIGGVFTRFPLLEIIPRVEAYLFGLVKNPLRTRFSKEGNSGAWVVDPASQTWIGMIAGGDDRGSTYVLDAGPLRDYFCHILNERNMAATMTRTWYRTV